MLIGFIALDRFRVKFHRKGLILFQLRLGGDLASGICEFSRLELIFDGDETHLILPNGVDGERALEVVKC